MSSGPWLSLMLPMFRVRPWLADCMQSILAQERRDGIEILLLDDASDDGCLALAQDYERQHPGLVRVLQHAANRGIAAARNSLLAAARGEYLWFVDPDDLMEPGAIAALRDRVEGQRPDLLMCDFRVLREAGGTAHRGDQHVRSFTGPSDRLLSDRSLLMQGLFEAGYLQPWCKIVRRACWPAGLHFPDGRFFEDAHLMPRAMLAAPNFLHVPQVWIAYRQRAGSVLARLDPQKLDDMSRALLGFGAELRRAGVSEPARFALAYFAVKTFICACRHARRQGVPSAPYLQHLWQTTDFSRAALRIQYLRRGWLWRWLRLSWWLRQARTDT